jgi:hypothetical protein
MTLFMPDKGRDVMRAQQKALDLVGRIGNPAAALAALKGPPYSLANYPGTANAVTTPGSPQWVIEASDGITYTDGGTATTRQWTMPSDGMLHVQATICLANQAVDPNNCYIGIAVNGSVIRQVARTLALDSNTGATESIMISADVPVHAGDTVAVYGRAQASTPYGGSGLTTWAQLRYVRLTS